ncbi:MAG: methyltransferase [Oscillospiraceae bacterium]|nr:methyltransferase [Oscillospiraceae bacterium]MBQ7815873.1 methyltransferase [Oscillospiraceae bacterium]
MEYTVETLAHGTKVCINKTHRFGTDAFLLSHFAEVKYAQKALDMGTGCGIIPLRWKDMGHKGEAFGLEIDPMGTELLKESIRLNGCENLTAICGDVRSFKTEKADFDVITCNPPYFTAGKPKDDEKKASFRHQLTLTDDDVAAAAYRLLRDNGKLCICQRPDQLAQVIFAMKNNRIEPKVIRFVRQRKNSPHPWLVLIDGRKNGGKSLTIMPDLFMEDDNGGPSIELQKIYGKIE